MPGVIQIVATPGSGNGRARSTARRLHQALARRGYDVHTQTFADLERLVAWAAACPPAFSHLVCVGGDATLSAAAPASVRLSIPFLPVPNGFGNVFTGAFGHVDRTQRVIESLERGRTRRVDVGMLNGREIFLSHHSYGLLEDIQQAVEHGSAQPTSRRLRFLAYFAKAERFVLTAPLPAIRVEVDGTLLVEAAAVVTVANVETYRGYLTLTPGASPLDGLFDVFAIPSTSKFAVWSQLIKLLFGLPGCWEGVMLGRGRCVRVTVNGQAPDELSVRRRALPLLVPPETSERATTRQPEPAAVATGRRSLVPSAAITALWGAGLRPRRRLAAAPRRARAVPPRSRSLVARDARA